MIMGSMDIGMTLGGKQVCKPFPHGRIQFVVRVKSSHVQEQNHPSYSVYVCTHRLYRKIDIPDHCMHIMFDSQLLLMAWRAAVLMSRLACLWRSPCRLTQASSAGFRLASFWAAQLLII